MVNSLDSAFFGVQKIGFVSQKLAVSHGFCFGGFRRRTPGPPPFSLMNSTWRTRRSANSLQPRVAARARRGPSAPLGPRLCDEELTFPGDNTRFASERNSSETRFARHEVSPRVRAILGKSGRPYIGRGLTILKHWILMVAIVAVMTENKEAFV